MLQFITFTNCSFICNYNAFASFYFSSCFPVSTGRNSVKTAATRHATANIVKLTQSPASLNISITYEHNKAPILEKELAIPSAVVYLLELE